MLILQELALFSGLPTFSTLLEDGEGGRKQRSWDKSVFIEILVNAAWYSLSWTYRLICTFPVTYLWKHGISFQRSEFVIFSKNLYYHHSDYTLVNLVYSDQNLEVGKARGGRTRLNFTD